MPRVLDSVRKRFSETAEAVAALQDQRAEEERRRVAQVLPLKGTERVLDVGTGAGALALAVAPIAGEVVGIDVVPELLAEARKRAPGNLELVEGDATRLPFPFGSFDVVMTARTLHHIARPDVVLAEMARVLADVDLRGLFDVNGLVLRRSDIVSEDRDLERYLDLAGCTGEERERARSLAPSPVTGQYGWYLLAKPSV